MELGALAESKSQSTQTELLNAGVAAGTNAAANGGGGNALGTAMNTVPVAPANQMVSP